MQFLTIILACSIGFTNLFLKELAYTFGGDVAPGLKREYGKAMVSRVEGCTSKLLEGLPAEFQMWMSHGDKLHATPTGFKHIGKFLLFYTVLISVI